MAGMSPVRVLPADPAAIDEAAALLRAGGLVAFPTETVYGLGANALDATALARIYAAKGRPASNPLIAHVSDTAMARTVVATWPDVAQRLAEACWPGPLTLVLPRRPELPPALSAGLPAVGVRVPAHPVAQALIRAAGVPVAAPSANPYMGVSPTLAWHVEAGLRASPEPVLVLDGGPAAVGLESTVLDLTQAVPTVLRLGGLPLDRLRALLGEVATLSAEPGDQPLPSPGLARRHYAPRTPLLVVADAETEAARLRGEGKQVATIPLGADPVAYGAALYATLHELDARGYDVIVAAAPPADDAWAAVRDRLKRATG